MDEVDKEAKLKVVRQHIQKNREAWLAWSERAAESFVNELIAGNLIRSDQAEFARMIIAPDLHDAAKRSFNHVLAEIQLIHKDHQS